MTVIDANVVVIALIGSDDAATAAGEALANETVLRAPAHFVSEVLGAIRWQAAGGRITWEDAEAAAQTLPDLGIKLEVPTTLDINRTWELCRNVTPQDGLYIALAERLGETFITADARIKRANLARCPIQTLTKPA